MSEAYSVSTGGEGQHKCARCKTYIESYDLMLGVSSITFGIKGTEMWRHLDCTDQMQVQAVSAEGEEFIPDHLAGWSKLSEEDQEIVSQTIVDMSQGLNLKASDKRKKEGRKEPLLKFKDLTSPSKTTTAPDSSTSTSTSLFPENESPKKAIEPATPWHLVAQQKRKLAAKPKPKAKKPKLVKKEKTGESDGEEDEDNKSKAKEGEGEEGDEEGDEEDAEGKKKAMKLKPPPKKRAKKVIAEGDAEKKVKRKKSEKKTETKSKVKSDTSVTRKSQDPDAPPRAKTGYMYFMASRRETLVEEHSDATPKEVLVMMGEEWSELGGEGKAKFEKLGLQDKRRHQRQQHEFKQYGSFTVEIEQFDDSDEEPAPPRARITATPSPNGADKQQKAGMAAGEEFIPNQLRADAHAVAQSKLSFGHHTTPEEPLPDKDKKSIKKKGSFHKGGLRPVSRLF